VPGAAEPARRATRRWDPRAGAPLGIGLLAWAPLASGFLVDDFDVETLHPDDFRRRSRFREATSRVEQLRAFAAARGRILRELAVAWVLAQPGVTAAIVGARTADEAAAIADGTDWQLTDADLTELDGLM
jgi:aryl-alcohol dehydrogenase-like predicted oxidoreductase